MTLIEPFHFTNFLANYCLSVSFLFTKLLFSQLCDDNWNQTLVIPLASSGKNDDHSNEIIYTLTPIGKKTLKYLFRLVTFNTRHSLLIFFREIIFQFDPNIPSGVITNYQPSK